MADNEDTVPQPQEEVAPEAGDADAAVAAPEEEVPAEDAPQEEVAAEAPTDKIDGQQDAVEEAPAEAATASEAAAAVAARLMAEHGEQTYPISSGADHEQAAAGGDTNNNISNKRARDEGANGEDLDGPDKKRAAGDMLSAGQNAAQNGAEAAPTGFVAAAGPVNPVVTAAGSEMVSDTFEVPSHLVGKLIGRAGETIRTLQMTTDTRIQVDHSGEGPNKRVTISAYAPEQVARARAAILALDAEETTQTMDCPASVVGRIIGRGGETIRALQSASEAHITVNQDFPADQPRQIVVQGKPAACERAMLMVSELIHGEPGSAQAIIQRVCAQHGIGQTDVMTAPKMIVGRIIGRGGETIKQIQKASGATIQIDQGGDPCRITLAGQPASVQQAKAFIIDIMNGGDPFMTGGGGGGGGGGGMPGFGGYGGPPPFGGGGGGYPQPAAFGGYPPAGGFGGGGGFPGGYGGFQPQPAYGGYPQQGGGDPYAGYAAAGGQYGGTVGSGYGAVDAGMGVGPQGGGGGGGGASAWVQYHDEQGRAYYYNPTTQVTQWEKPADA